MSQTPTAMRFWFALASAPVLGALGTYLAFHPFLHQGWFIALASAGLVLVSFLTTAKVVVQQPSYLLATITVFLSSYGLALWMFPTHASIWAAIFMLAALVFNGISRIAPVIRAKFDQPLPGKLGRAGGLFLGFTSLLFAVLVYVWPLLFVGLVELIFGLWFLVQAVRSLVFARRCYRAQKLSLAGELRPVAGHNSGSGAVLWGSIGILSGAALVLVTGILLSGDTKTEPDDFYQVSGSLPATAGQLIKYEPLADRAGGSGLAEGLTGWRILYTTTSDRGEITVASGTVVVNPEEAVQGQPILAIAHGTTGIVPACAPSLAPKPLDGGATAATEQMADLGWAVVTSDYVGLGTPGPHPYLVGPPAAYNVLDAALAAQQLPGLGLSDDTVLWGHSQGGHGALWSAGLASEYAPSLNVLGLAALAPATDLFELAINVKDSAPGKIVSAYIAGAWQEVYPELGVEDYLRRDYQHTIDQVAQNCFSGLDSLASIARTSQMSGAVFADDAFDPAGPVAAKLRENSVSPQTSGPIDVPVLIAQGEADSLVLASMQDDWVTKMCAAGQDLEYRTYPGLDHMPLVDPDSPLTPQLVQWTQDRLAGKPARSTC